MNMLSGNNRKNKLSKDPTFKVAVIFALAIVAIQIWSTVRNTRHVERILNQIQAAQSQQISDEKARQEVLALRIQNETKAFFWESLVTSLSPMVGVIVALVGGWLGLRSYLGTREKERIDRAATDLKDILDLVASKEPRERAVGIVGLQHFLAPDKDEYYLRVLSALMTAARLEEDAEVMRGIRIAAEQAIKNLPEEILQQVSWQGVKLRGVDFSKRSLQNLDLRDANLEDAVLTGCNLSGSLFTNARLNGAKIDNGVLDGVDFSYADFAGATLEGSVLDRAVLHHAKVGNLNLRRADLREAVFFPEEVPWDLTKNWREAIFGGGVLDRLLKRYGPEASGFRVLMLMWEIPPLIAGGTWTACYHIVRNLRRLGANVTVVVPWRASSIVSGPFGCEVEVVGLGVIPPRNASSPYSTASWSPYAPSAYAQRTWSGYSAPSFYSPYSIGSGPYPGYFLGYARAEEMGLRAGSTLLRLTEEFRKRLLRYARREEFDLIHAHDWVTFEAAAAAAEEKAKPWVAHFHSTEADRRPESRDAVIRRREQNGAESATRVLTPSRATARRVHEEYKVAESKIEVVPNPLSVENLPSWEMGAFETSRVIFLGRLASQKGPDLFTGIAAEVKRRYAAAQFWMFGSGERIGAQDWFVEYRGALEWSRRGEAFIGASALLVPSRSEPFGMVVLEGMQHGVPVLYPDNSGVAEVIKSGIRIDPANTARTAEQLNHLLTDWNYWEDVVQEQSAEIAGYPERGYESRIIELWRSLLGKKQSVTAAEMETGSSR